MWLGGNMGLGEIDGLLVPPDKASNLLTMYAQYEIHERFSKINRWAACASRQSF